MFDSNEFEIITRLDVTEPELKQLKINVEDELLDYKTIHSSLNHVPIRAPPLVAYKSLDSYCEKTVGNFTIGVNDLQSIGSPIVLKSPPVPHVKVSVPEGALPYVLFPIDELSAIRCLKNWANTKVSVVGQISFDPTTDQFYLNSSYEQSHCSLIIDTSLVKEILKLGQLLQVFGNLEIYDSRPSIKVYFTRNLSWVDLPQMMESYKAMQEQVKLSFLNTTKTRQDIVFKDPESSSEIIMNDTLDNCDFSSIM